MTEYERQVKFLYHQLQLHPENAVAIAAEFDKLKRGLVNLDAPPTTHDRVLAGAQVLAMLLVVVALIALVRW